MLLAEVADGRSNCAGAIVVHMQHGSSDLPAALGRQGDKGLSAGRSPIVPPAAPSVSLMCLTIVSEAWNTPRLTESTTDPADGGAHRASLPASQLSREVHSASHSMSRQSRKGMGQLCELARESPSLCHMPPRTCMQGSRRLRCQHRMQHWKRSSGHEGGGGCGLQGHTQCLIPARCILSCDSMLSSWQFMYIAA